MKVLVVDDVQIIRRMLREMLDGFGWQVVEAGTGEEAMESLRQHPDVRLILLDCHMPSPSGIEFLLQLRSEPQFQVSPKVIMMSAKLDEALAEEAIVAGADDCIPKPIRLAALRAMLRRFAPNPV